LAIILFVLLSFSFGLYIVCPFVVFLWPLYCLSFGRFPLAIILFVLWSFFFGHYIVCPFVVFLLPLYCFSFCRFPFAIFWQKENKQRTNNIMAKGKRQKDKQYKAQRKTTKGQTI
jgi:predicted membrane protein